MFISCIKVKNLIKKGLIKLWPRPVTLCGSQFGQDGSGFSPGSLHRRHTSKTLGGRLLTTLKLWDLWGHKCKDMPRHVPSSVCGKTFAFRNILCIVKPPPPAGLWMRLSDCRVMDGLKDFSVHHHSHPIFCSHVLNGLSQLGCCKGKTPLL